MKLYFKIRFVIGQSYRFYTIKFYIFLNFSYNAKLQGNAIALQRQTDHVHAMQTLCAHFFVQHTGYCIPFRSRNYATK